MDARQCETLRNKLMEYLEKVKLSWVRDQVSARIAEGKPVKKRLLIASYDESTGVRSGRRKRVTYVGTEPFTGVEELRILLDAINSAVVSTCDMESQILENIARRAVPNAVTFIPDDSKTSTIQIDAQSVSSKALGLEQLKVALAYCKKELASNGD